MIRRIVVALVVVLVAAPALAGQRRKKPPKPKKIQVLIFSGQNNHNWRQTTPYMKEMLEAAGKFEVRVTDEPRGITADTIKHYDVILDDYNGPAWGKATEDAVTAFIKDHGKGFVVIHAANNCHRLWPEFEKMIGGAWWAGAGHGSMHRFNVRIVDREHPITRWTNLYNVNIGSALNLVTEKGDRIIGKSKEGPLMVLREPEEGPRLIALAFELSASDLPMRAAWPLLFLNTINYLGGENLEVASSRASPRESWIAPTWIQGTKHHGSPPTSSPRRPPLWLVIALGVTILFAMEWFTYHKRITV